VLEYLHRLGPDAKPWDTSAAAIPHDVDAAVRRLTGGAAFDYAAHHACCGDLHRLLFGGAGHAFANSSSPAYAVAFFREAVARRDTTRACEVWLLPGVARPLRALLTFDCAPPRAAAPVGAVGGAGSAGGAGGGAGGAAGGGGAGGAAGGGGAGGAAGGGGGGGGGAGGGAGGAGAAGARSFDDLFGVGGPGVPVLNDLVASGARLDEQQKLVLALRDAAWPAATRDAVFEAQGVRPGTAVMTWGLSYSQFVCVSYRTVLDEHNRREGLALPDGVLERGVFLVQCAHVREQQRRVLCLMAHKGLTYGQLTEDNHRYWIVRIGASDAAAPSDQLQRAFKQVRVDAERFVFTGDSAPIRTWVETGRVLEYHVRYNGAGPPGAKLGVSLELSTGMCVPAIGTGGPSANTSAVGVALQRF